MRFAPPWPFHELGWPTQILPLLFPIELRLLRQQLGVEAVSHLQMFLVPLMQLHAAFLSNTGLWSAAFCWALLLPCLVPHNREALHIHNAEDVVIIQSLVC